MITSHGRRLPRVLTTAFLASAMALVLVTPASADDPEPPDGSLGEYANPEGTPGNVTGGDIWDGLNPSSPDSETLDAIIEYANAYAAMEGNTPEARAEAEAILTQYGISTSELLANPTGQAAQTQKLLSLTQYAQTKNYYCGPATGYMMLRYMGKTTSVYDGATLSQTNLANSTYMQTETYHATKWASGRFPLSLNRWMYGSGSGTLQFHAIPKPSAALTKSAVVSRIDKTSPFAADTVEIAGGAHYNNHPSYLTIGHWIAGYGYKVSGSTVCFADPATSVWSGLQKTFCHTTSSFATSYLQSNGIVA